MTQDGLALRYASDRNIVEVVIGKLYSVFKYLTRKQNGRALEYASVGLKENQEVVLAAVMQNGMALEYASDRLKNNIDVVLAAVIQNGEALYYASDEWKNDFFVVCAAVSENGKALR